MIDGLGLDFLDDARRRDLELAVRISAECRRPEVPWAHDVMGPTEAWRGFLADTDPEFRADDDSEAA